MSPPRSIQHVSGQGTRWALYEWEWNHEPHDTWLVHGGESAYHLPRSEFHLIEPPAHWIDVTAACWCAPDDRVIYTEPGPRGIPLPPTYRLRKVQLIEIPTPQQLMGDAILAAFPRLWAFLVERREEEP